MRRRKLSIFSRLTIGYLAIFLLLLAISLYALFQLDRFHRVVGSVVESDVRLIDYENKLGDAFLAQIRAERKFLITADDSFYNQALLYRSDFDQQLEEIEAAAEPQWKDLLVALKKHYRRSLDLFENAVRLVKAGRPLPESEYRGQKEEAEEQVRGTLIQLRALSEESTRGKMATLSAAGYKARRIAVAMSGVSLFLVVAISFVITRGITGPVGLLKRKTREIAQGKWEPDVRISSPPEMAELAGAFNLMCHKLKDLDRMKSDFFASMSHELRTPLTSIKEGSGMLLEGVGGSMTDKQRKVLTILFEESNRLIHLVNSLLDLSKMEAGMMAYMFAPTQVAPLVQKAVAELGPFAEAKRISLEARLGDELPAVNADRERILQVLRNLVGNAVKFTPNGGRVTLCAGRRDGGVEVRVEDTGPGIPRESLETIFNKYEQAKTSRSGRIDGSGLGLAIVRHIITAHGGRVWAESEPGRGSSFIFVLPA